MAEREIMIGGRRLSQFKVDELKVELEKRGLKKSGNKGILIERLQEAIDKEMEQKEGYESFSPSQQMQQEPVTNAWPLPMMQQQQQQKHPGGFTVQPMRIQQQGLLNQPQGMLNQPHVAMNQQPMMMNQQQQITSPVQVNEFREQWPQAQIPQTQVSQSQLPQSPVPQSQVPQSQVPQSQVLQAQVPQPYHQPQENQTPLNQMPPISEPAPPTHPPSQPSIEPELESSSSSDNEQDSVQQSSSSSSPDTDDQEQKQPTSLLNYNYPAEQKPDTAVSVEAVKDNESGTIKEEGHGEDEEKAMPLNNGPGENLTVDIAPAEEEMKPQVEEEEGEIREEEEEQKTLPEEKEKEVENEKENEPPEEASNTAKSQQQPSPAEENTFEVEPSEEDKAVVEEPKVPSPPKSTSPFVTKKRKISIPRTSLPSTPTSEGQPSSRKRRWGSSSSSKKKTSLSISTDSLKDLIPGVQVHSTPALEAVMDLGGDDDDEKEAEEEEKKMEQKVEEEKEPAPVQTPEAILPEGKRRKDRIVKVEEKKTIKLQRKPVVFEMEQEPVKMEVEEDPITPKTDNPHTRRTSFPAQEASSPTPAERSPSPARYPESDVLHVKNLVRPFTLNQLKDLLSKHGTLAEDGFWIDKIKSHCYVVYASVEEAAASRQALHGAKWPLTSPKILAVDFANEEEMARDTEGVLGKKKEKERDVTAEKVIKEKPPVAEEKPAAEEAVEEVEEQQKNPGNLLDNLFQKTKTVPCLYWLPLSDDQIATRDREREERRKARQEERDKENEERKEKQQQREKEREKEQREREAEKQRSRSPRNRRREQSRSKSRSPRGPRRR